MQYIDIINVWLVALLNELIYNPLVINDFLKSWFPPMVWSRETSVDGLHSSTKMFKNRILNDLTQTKHFPDHLDMICIIIKKSMMTCDCLQKYVLSAQYSCE